MKTLEDYFIDWEGHVFGYGYGTGEQYTIPALKLFFECLENGRGTNSYNFEVLERVLGQTTAWLLINILCHADIIEYGTSPRFGWLTNKGERLKKFLFGKSKDNLYDLVMSTDENYIHCYPDACNCGEGYVKGKICQNPFWLDV